MREKLFTPGDWISTFSGHNKRAVRAVRAPNHYICFLTEPTHFHGQDERYERDLEENKADADLMAAAKKLLEALEGLRRMYPSENDMLKTTLGGAVRGFSEAAIKACEDADKAIAKAYGDKP